ncbi:hypothetical protein NU219Hw_g1749t1 [Hortaea werneckii]
MSAASLSMPLVAGTLSLGAVIAGLASLPSVRELVAHYLGDGATRHIWKLAALAFALANFKNLPGIWHLRVFRGIIYQIYFQPTQQPPKHLFAPIITSSRNTPWDTDYNLHKSNSTYFADLDIGRAHAMGLIIRTGLSRLNKGDEEGLTEDIRNMKGSYNVALGAVSCFFQRQIEPFQAFEVWTRVLSWDRKWLYLVSHVVKKGVIKPDSYVLQPWKKSKKTAAEAKKDEEDLTKHIFATSVSRYVFKKGRLTLNPEIILERSRLLPSRPEGVGFPPRAEMSVDTTPAESTATPAQNGDLTSPESLASGVTTKLDQYSSAQKPADDDNDDWTWDDMEKERLRGLRTAIHFDKLNACHGELRAGDVLGEYGDYF